MSGYNPRRGPNVSQYIANLNATDNSQQDAVFDLDNDDLASFINSDIWDFELGGNIPQVGIDFTAPSKEQVEGRDGAAGADLGFEDG